MAWAERGKKDREAFNKYVESLPPALNAWEGVPGLDVSIDSKRSEAAIRKAEREGWADEAGGSEPPSE